MHACNNYIPVVTRFFCPPEIPLLISSPTIISAHISNPSTYFVAFNKISIANVHRNL
ncbi:hypothetical protein MA16_Dca019383 [Dendrobium catenatum]|uniref:Uncharacterized protein n=1 Tax=Dendrobium catenatum TaxID=906689 RepID=A0A2I0VWT0_9ASPA|nr:hypothetical protein MA16_Dca019383 [Dendrobium catenatum]